MAVTAGKFQGYDAAGRADRLAIDVGEGGRPPGKNDVALNLVRPACEIIEAIDGPREVLTTDGLERLARIKSLELDEFLSPVAHDSAVPTQAEPER
jgi:hypothetical protein